MMAVGNPLVVPLAAVSILGLLTYTSFKRRWWAGPFYNAWIVAVLFLIGVLDGAPGRGFRVLTGPEVAPVAAVVFFGYANFVLAGYFKDVSADRATGYDTLPVRYGLPTAAWVSDLFAALAVGGTAVAGSPAVSDGGDRCTVSLLRCRAGNVTGGSGASAPSPRRLGGPPSHSAGRPRLRASSLVDRGGRATRLDRTADPFLCRLLRHDVEEAGGRSDLAMWPWRPESDISHRTPRLLYC